MSEQEPDVDESGDETPGNHRGPRGPEGRVGREGREGPPGREGREGIRGPSGSNEPGLTAEVQELILLVSANTAAIQDSDERQRETKRLAKRANVNSIIAIVAVIAAVIVGVKAWGVADDAQDAAKVAQSAADAANEAIEQSCENGNASRAGNRQVWSEYFKITLASNRAQGVPQVIIDYLKDLRDWVVEGVFFDSDCEDPEYVRPEPPTPPSFEEALEAARDLDE